MSVDRFPGIDRGIRSTVSVIVGRAVPFADNLRVNPNSLKGDFVGDGEVKQFPSTGSIRFSQRVRDLCEAV